MSKDKKEEKTEQEQTKEVFENWMSETFDKYDKEKDKKK